MSKPDNKKIEFHATVGIDKEQIRESNMGIIRYKQDSQARDLGLLIAQTKGWKTSPIDDMHVSHLDVFVFTKAELMDYMEAEFKERLQKMAREALWTDETQRHTLMIASERF